MRQDNTGFYLIIGLGLVALTICILWFMPHSEKVMTIRSMGWHREIRELEDYYKYECDTRTIRNSDGKDETKTDCGYKKYTRLINKWITSANYPIEPYWETNYTISSGHYENRSERYTIVFSDDKELYPYNCYLSQYLNMKPREKHKVALNIFNSVIGIIE